MRPDVASTLVLDLVQAVGDVADGDTVSVPAPAGADPQAVAAAARAWCAHTGNTLLRAAAGQVVVRRGHAATAADLRADLRADLPADRRPGTRLWIYTNFDCNLSCDYCCVRSSPRTPRRELGLDRIRRLAAEAAAAGVAELLLTGGEPFLLPDLDQIVAACADRLPTTLLTNGMLFRGRRLAILRAMPRDRVRLQISLDSATPDRHDAHRGPGTWARALAGIRTATAEGFRVRVAATLADTDPAEERQLREFLTAAGVAEEDQVLRPLARRGFAETGLVLTPQTLVPEVTVTADGVYWHPVGADDADQLVTRDLFPLAAAIDAVCDRFHAQQARADERARAFPCA